MSPVKTIYDALSKSMKTKTKDAVFVFWDEMCLNIGQNWEKSFLQGLLSSRIITLVISMKALEGISQKASYQQDNVLIEYPRSIRLLLHFVEQMRYECAILLNKLKDTTVVPLFVADGEKDETSGEVSFTPFRFQNLDPATFPNVPHARGLDAQHTIDSMRYYNINFTSFSNLI